MKSPLKIAHVATVDARGGAALAAFRLHQGLLEAGIASRMVVQKKVSALETVDLVELQATPFPWQAIEDYAIGMNRSPGWNTYYSLGYPGTDLTGHPSIQGANLIHLHWVAGFQSIPAIASLQALGKPMVWTLHDQRPFTGGCHFARDCRKFETDCDSCPQLASDPFRLAAANLSDSKALLKTEAMTIVAPSQWLAECARRSGLFQKCEVHVVPYGLDVNLFQPDAGARDALGLDLGSVNFLFGADYISEIRKGFGHLLDAAKQCMSDADFAHKVQQGRIRFLCFGNPTPELESFPAPITYLGYVNSAPEMSRLYSAADLFLLPTLQDNLPNTMLESMSCGTPVAAFGVGGVVDVLTHGENGFLIAPGDSAELARTMVAVAKSPQLASQMRGICRQRIVENYPLKTQARRMEQIYSAKIGGRSSVQPKENSKIGPAFFRILPKLVQLPFSKLVEAYDNGTMSEEKRKRFPKLSKRVAWLSSNRHQFNSADWADEFSLALKEFENPQPRTWRSIFPLNYLLGRARTNKHLL